MATDLEPVAVNPRTGETIDLPNARHENLVEALLVLQAHERRAKEWRTAVEDELVRRHGERRSAQVVGGFEVDIDRGYTRVWDAEELELVLVDLVAAGLVASKDMAGVITREPKTDGRKMQTLLNRVDGDALVELRRCFKWEQRGRAKVRVTLVAELET